MALRLIYLVFSKLISWMILLAQSQQAKEIEILVLRHQLAILQRRIPRPRMNWADRALTAALARLLPTRRRLGLLVTILRWHRRLVARGWTTQPTPPGRPPLPSGLCALAVRLATENSTSGYRRSHGELARLGYQIGASTVWKILRSAGLDPSPRRTGPSWAEFLRADPHGILACDLFHLDGAVVDLYLQGCRASGWGCGARRCGRRGCSRSGACRGGCGEPGWGSPGRAQRASCRD